MAAMAFTACSNDDEPSVGGGNGTTQGELIEAITVAFTNPTNTYAYKDPVDGVGSENGIYTAYIFAKEANPTHDGALQGDWTVKEVKGANENTPIAEGDGSTSGTRKNMATFAGVRQGDNVYVIANDASLTLPLAEGIAHRGDESEEAIKSYVASLNKNYLSSLTVKDDNAQTGKFIMAGKATIPTNPTTPNGTTVKVPVALDRELAKVTFSATVSSDPADEAYGNIQLEEGDGLIVVRVPRKVSFFADQVRDWYFPLAPTSADKDWSFNDAGEDQWLVAFNGDKESAPATSAADFFNATPLSKDGKEYRFTWATSSSPATDLLKSSDLGSGSAKITSPFFYVTPNYAAHTGCATVIVTQATVVNTMLKDVVTAEMLEEALQDATFTGTGGINANEITKTTWNTDANITALRTFLSGKYPSIFTAADYPDNDSLIYMKKGDKAYYRADVANYEADNATSKLVTERNTFYQIQGTITTMGAKSIEDAINSDNISMMVQVTVNPWQVVVNRVNM